MSMEREHGTNARYVSSGCRCKDCKEAHALYMLEYRRRLQQGTYVYRSKIKYGRPLASDQIAGRVGHDFPALGTVLRSLAVMSA